jgi:GNAT superfamily N-acetyltransferase
VHVRADDVATTRLLESTGWRTESVVTQLVHGGTPLAPAREDVMALTPADMADLRALLAAGGASEAMLAGCYGDDFFVRAAPVWVYGARDEAGRLTGCVAVRRQLRSAMVFALTVSPEARGSGLGRALADRAVATARANGAEFCHAEAEPEALSLALSCGFAPVGAWRRLER